jgi:hypothetical protein
MTERYHWQPPRATGGQAGLIGRCFTIAITARWSTPGARSSAAQLTGVVNPLPRRTGWLEEFAILVVPGQRQVGSRQVSASGLEPLGQQDDSALGVLAYAE